MIVEYAIYERGKRRGRRSLVDAVSLAREGSGAFAWIGLVEPTSAEFDEVRELLELHPLAVEDAVHAHQRPKLERYDDTMFVVLKTARYDDEAEQIEIGEIMLFVADWFIVTVRHGESGALGRVRRLLEDDPEQLRLGPGAVLHAAADQVVDDYATVLAELDIDVDQIEDDVFSAGRRNHAERIYKLKRQVQAFRRAVAPLQLPLEQLMTTRDPQIHEDLHEYYRDVHDHLLRAIERIGFHNDLLNSALNANLAQISIRQNEDMRRISAWVAIIAVPTAIAGIYGMNFRYMPELDQRWGYPGVLIGMLVLCVVLYRWFKRSGWL